MWVRVVPYPTVLSLLRGIVFSSLFVSMVASAADVQQFRIERLRVPGRVLGVQAEDCDKNGKRDLVVVFSVGRPPTASRKIGVFFDRGGSYGSDPDQVIDAPPGATFIDLIDAEGDGRKSILVGDAKGLGVLLLHVDPTGRFDPNPKRMSSLVGLLSIPDDDDLPFMDVGRDWNGDGSEEILLPMVDRVAVIQRLESGAWDRTAELRLSARASHSVRSQQYEIRLRNFWARSLFTFPELTVADWDGDGKKDLFAVVDDMVQVYRGAGATGVFSPTPAARILLGVRTEAEAQRGNAHVTTMVRDIDGDGVADLAVNKIAGGLGQMKAQTGFYYGKKGGGFDRPAQVINRDGYSGALSFADLDGDGKLDLVMPHANVGIGEMARVLMSKKMSVGWEIRRNLGNKQFSAAPDRTRDVDFPLDYSVVADIEGAFPSVQGDFNGDGKNDFVSGYGADAFAVWLGGGKQMLSDNPKAIVHSPPSRFYFVTQLETDRFADLIVFHRGNDALANTVTVLRNTGHGW